eukprot:jgi/Ulvmu1/6553/UM003_0187.1
MQVWDQLINAICRPYRICYKTADLFGGINGITSLSTSMGAIRIRRQDFVITNQRDERLQCSYWEPDDPIVTSKPIPAVVYCHCNSGSRLDAAEAISILLPMGVRVFALDFSGSGISEGDYVTLGANEVEDLSCLVDFIRGGGHTSLIALWGRSMGAVTSLLYSERDPSVAALVLDSPFSRLTDLMRELAEEQKIPLWSMLGGTALRLMRRSVKKRAGFDINTISPVDSAPRAHAPAFFGHASSDTFVQPHHSARLFEAYSGDKERMVFEQCDHNSPRPIEYYNSAAGFLSRALRVPFEASMLQSVMSETSMLLPGIEMGQTHPISPFGPTMALSEYDGDGGEVDYELQQALALSLESCSVASSSPSARTADAAAAAAAVVAAAGPPAAGAAGRPRGGDEARCQSSSAEGPPLAPAGRPSAEGNEATLDDGKSRVSTRVTGGVQTLLRQLSPLGADPAARSGSAHSMVVPELSPAKARRSGERPQPGAAVPKDPPSARGAGVAEAGSRSASSGTGNGSLAAGGTPADPEAVATRTATDTFMPADCQASSIMRESRACGSRARGSAALPLAVVDAARVRVGAGGVGVTPILPRMACRRAGWSHHANAVISSGDIIVTAPTIDHITGSHTSPSPPPAAAASRAPASPPQPSPTHGHSRPSRNPDSSPVGSFARKSGAAAIAPNSPSFPVGAISIV